ncbi:MAG: NVEALA domain-containing protein [Bacteroidaceae bacterium]|nr:NVEALA domain-containing protein [Bacteroidaceae bacterium]
MKKLLLSAVVLFAAVAGYNCYNNSSSYDAEMSEMAKSNVKALAYEDEGKGCKFNLKSICETSHSDHYLYRNR